MLVATQHGRPSEGAEGHGNDEETRREEGRVQDELQDQACCEAGEEDRQEVDRRPVRRR